MKRKRIKFDKYNAGGWETRNVSVPVSYESDGLILLPAASAITAQRQSPQKPR